MRTGVIIVRLSGPELIAAAAQTLYRYDCLWLTLHPSAPDLYTRRLKYLSEPPPVDPQEPQERWYTYEEMLERGGGDCKVLACAAAAWRTVRLNQESWPIVRRYQNTYHVVTGWLDKWGQLQVEDPSCTFGMEGCSTFGQVLAPYIPYR